MPSGRQVRAAFPAACSGFIAAVLAELSGRCAELECRMVELKPNRSTAQAVGGEADVADVVLPAGHPLRRMARYRLPGGGV